MIPCSRRSTRPGCEVKDPTTRSTLTRTVSSPVSVVSLAESRPSHDVSREEVVSRFVSGRTTLCLLLGFETSRERSCFLFVTRVGRTRGCRLDRVLGCLFCSFTQRATLRGVFFTTCFAFTVCVWPRLFSLSVVSPRIYFLPPVVVRRTIRQL